jgi:hypothetical protein
VEIIGECPAGITPKDEVYINGMQLENPRNHNVCFLAITHFPIMVWQLQSDDRFFSHASCPGCTTRMKDENRVVFLLAHEDKKELSQLISDYVRLNKNGEETESARRLKEEAIKLQEQGNFSSATNRMKAALNVLRESVKN